MRVTIAFPFHIPLPRGNYNVPPLLVPEREVLLHDLGVYLKGQGQIEYDTSKRTLIKIKMKHFIYNRSCVQCDCFCSLIMYF